MSYSVITLAGGGFAYFDGSLTTPQEVFPSPRVEYPFPGDQLTRVIRRRYHVLQSSYCPAALDQTDSVYTLAYLVSDIPVQELPGGVWEIERTFAEVPTPQQEFESYVFAFPGLNASVIAVTGASTTLTGAAYNATTGILSWSSPSVVTGEQVIGRLTGEWGYQVSGIFGTITYPINQAFSRQAISPTAVNIGRKFVLSNRPVFISTSGISASAFTFESVALSSRKPIQLASVSRIEDVYFLAGESPAAAVSFPSDIESLQVFAVRQLYGALETETVTAFTDPSLNEYAEMIATESEIVAEESRVERYLGNIYRRRTRYMKAK
jgi:peptidoglycan hydrolase-like protein with peptidoglycan-binding domain